VLTLAELILTDLGPNPDGTPRLLTERAKKDLAAYGWPENVRELRRVLETAASRAGRAQIAPRHLPEYLSDPHQETPLPDLLTLEQLEARHISDVLQRVGGNRAKAAQLLGIAASTLYDKLRRYALDQ
jgi:DNA-binding NtrC family response regulator